MGRVRSAGARALRAQEGEQAVGVAEHRVGVKRRARPVRQVLRLEHLLGD